MARLGGDEFAILLPQIDTHQHAALLAEKVLAVVSRPYPVDGGQATISAAIGVALSSDCAGDGASFLKCADMAMFRCKKSDKGCYELFHREMAAEAERGRSMQQRLREALGRGEFVLHYQPKVSFSSGTMTGCEALLRWQPPEQRLVMPGEFIDIVEESGLIVDIGAWVVRAACAQIAHWQCEELGIPVAVNVSAKQISLEFVRTVRAALEDAVIDGSLLQIELTESSVMQRTDEAIHVLNELRAMGLKVAIDDFGTGYSSLSLLKRVPVDVVKIDRSFVVGLPRNDSDASICRAVIQMAHSLNLRVIAEGIEPSAPIRVLEGARLRRGARVPAWATGGSGEAHRPVATRQGDAPGRTPARGFAQRICSDLLNHTAAELLATGPSLLFQVRATASPMACILRVTVFPR